MTKSLYVSDETREKLNEILKINKKFNASGEFAMLISRNYEELFGESLEILRKKQLEIIDKEKQILDEKRIVEEKIRQAEIKEPERLRLEEKKKEQDKMIYQNHFSDTYKYLIENFVIGHEDAEELTKEFWALPDKKRIPIREFARRKLYKMRNEWG